MRSRFLDTDYFSASSSSPLETLNFLKFSVPHLPPSHLPTFREDLLCCCFDRVLNISLEIERLPIDLALSKLFSDVLPQKVDFEDEDFDYRSSPKGFFDEQTEISSESVETRFSEQEGDVLYEEKKEVENRRSLLSKTWKNKFSKKNNEIKTADDKDKQRFELVQFETPKPDVFFENGYFSVSEEIQLLSEVPEIENNLDMLKPGPNVPCPYDIIKSMYLVENITSEYIIKQNAYSLEDNGSVQDQMHFCDLKFPFLEVDEICLETFKDLSMEDELFLVFENIEPQDGTQRDDLMSYSNELLGSVEYNILECLVHPCPQKQCLESEITPLAMSLDIDFISTVETSLSQGHSSLYQEKSDGNCFLSLSPVIFEEFEVIDMDSSQLFEVFFDTQIAHEPGVCEHMFGEDLNFKSFNELIVIHELALVDDSFKSLPVPVLSDHERSHYVMVEEMLSELEPRPLSASDGIYLDWYLLEEDGCNLKCYFSCQNMLEIDLHSIDFDLKYFDGEKLLFDFLFSSDTLNETNTEEDRESLDMISGGFDDRCPKSGNGEQLSERNAERASLIFKSLSQFNDLDFFLNRQKAPVGKNSEPAVTPLDADSRFPTLPSSDSSVSKALCEGVDMPPSTDNSMESLFPSYLSSEDQKLKELLNNVPAEEEYTMRPSESLDKLEASSRYPPFLDTSYLTESKKIQGTVASFPDTVIVVNTKNFDNKMIVSRRNTYQKILAMEKEGAQVVERDSDLPVDIIVSPGICLIWYDFRNIEKKATTLGEASPSIPLCVDNIATNVLTLLSFTFSSCILVFEGDISFLAAIMESSDGLYAAASSLGIGLQLFCSYSSQLTDEIILSCIGYATKLSRSQYPKMPEAETHAEAFLTKFPSINPLTAHAILSSGGMVIEFLEWSHEHRIQAIQKYCVPDESITLFSALCRYGEREDSRSIMTDCSSASSGPDSGCCYLKVDSERKRQKINGSPQKIDTTMDNLFHFGPLNQFTDGILNPSKDSKPYDSWMSKEPEMFEIEKPGLLNSMFDRKQGLDNTLIMNPSRMPKTFDSRMPTSSRILDEMSKPSFPSNEKLFCQDQALDTDIFYDIDWNDNNNSENLHKDLKHEVVDLTNSPLSCKDFSLPVPVMEKESTMRSKIARRLSFGRSSHPTFPVSGKINSGSDIWSPVRDRRLEGETYRFPDADLSNSMLPVRNQAELLEEVLMQRSAGNSLGMPFQEREVSHYGATPLSNAIRSAQPPIGTPWTIEFLNRIREKRGLRQQSLPCDTSSPFLGHSGSTSNVSKRKSPSILDFYKYKGSSGGKKIVAQKRKNHSRQLSSSSKDEKTSASPLPMWTPIDKRARQTLSFAMNGSGSQTKLVWSDRKAHALNKKA